MESQIKAISILVESMKLYVTLSTISIAGLLTFFTKNGDKKYSFLFFIALALFFSAAVTSIININYFVTRVFKGDNNIFTKTAKRINISAIIFFFFGIFISAFYLYFNINYTTPSSKTSIDFGIILENHKISIANDVKAKVIITKDLNGNIIKININ